MYCQSCSDACLVTYARGVHSGAGAASVAHAGAPWHERQLSLGCVQQAGGPDGRPRLNSSERSYLVHRGITEEV